MSLALYRKYRPQNWSDLTNQNHIKITLKNEIESSKVAHAFLFTGPRGVGKTTTARLLAKAINCTGRKPNESEPCNKCESCMELVAGNDLDILEIDAASHTGVDNVRENIIANARFTPVKRKYKVFIIDEVHMLSISAFNALLKILEEPPAHAVFILATTEIHKVPATIISRCQRFDFKKVNSEELINRLDWICQQEGIKIDASVLVSIARASEGCLRDAESLLGQVLSLGDKKITAAEASLIIPASNFNLVLELVGYLAAKNLAASITLINKLTDDGVDLMQFSDDLLELLRKMILGKISGSLKDFSFELEEKNEKQVIDLAALFQLNDLVELVNIFADKKIEIKSSAISQLPLEIAVIEYCQKTKAPAAAAPQKPQDPPPASFSDKPPIAPPPAREKSQPQASSSAQSTTLNANNSVKASPANLKITIEEIRNKWHSFLVRLQDENASLVFILKVAEPLELKGNFLQIGFKYSFHQQRINQLKIKEAIEKVLEEFFGEKIYVETTLLAKDAPSAFIETQTQNDEVEFVDELPNQAGTVEQGELIDNLVKVFNGKIVE